MSIHNDNYDSNTDLDNAEIVWDKDDSGGKTAYFKYPEGSFGQQDYNQGMAAVKEYMDRLLYENYRQALKNDATALAKPSELNAVEPHKVLTPGQKRELQAMKTMSDFIDLINKPVEWTLGKANDATGGKVYGFLGNPYVMAVMNTLTPSKWIGAAQTGYMPWDERNTGIQPGFEGADLEELSGYDLSHIYNNLFDTGVAFIPGAGMAGKIRQGLSGIRNARIARRVKNASPNSYPALQKGRFEEGKSKGYYKGDYEVPTAYVNLAGENWPKWEGYVDDYKSQLDDLRSDYDNRYHKLMTDNSISSVDKMKRRDFLDDELENKEKDLRNFTIDKIGRALEKEFGEPSYTKGFKGGNMEGFSPKNLSRKDFYEDIADAIIADNPGFYSPKTETNVLVAMGEDLGKAERRLKNFVESHEIAHHKNLGTDATVTVSLPKELSDNFDSFLRRKYPDPDADQIRYFTDDNHTELSARLSQYKNYLGKKFGDKITDDELLYAAKNYIQDTGENNYMDVISEWILQLDKKQRKQLLKGYANNPNAVLDWAVPVGAGLGLGASAASWLNGGSGGGDEDVVWE